MVCQHFGNGYLYSETLVSLVMLLLQFYSMCCLLFVCNLAHFGEGRFYLLVTKKKEITLKVYGARIRMRGSRNLKNEIFVIVQGNIF